MLVTRDIADVQIGGTGADNPTPFGDFSFDFDAGQLLFRYELVNAIVYHKRLDANLEVTCKVRLDNSGNPMMSDTDKIYLPCPPFCERED